MNEGVAVTLLCGFDAARKTAVLWCRPLGVLVARGTVKVDRLGGKDRLQLADSAGHCDGKVTKFRARERTRARWVSLLGFDCQPRLYIPICIIGRSSILLNLAVSPNSKWLDPLSEQGFGGRPRLDSL